MLVVVMHVYAKSCEVFVLCLQSSFMYMRRALKFFVLCLQSSFMYMRRAVKFFVLCLQQSFIYMRRAVKFFCIMFVVVIYVYAKSCEVFVLCLQQSFIYMQRAVKSLYYVCSHPLCIYKHFTALRIYMHDNYKHNTNPLQLFAYT